MKFNTDKLTLGNNNGVRGVFIEIPLNLLDKLKTLLEKEGLKSIEIKQHRDKRSLQANAYCWVLCDKIAKVLGTTAEEVYIDKLHDYGTCEYVGCLPNIIPQLKRTIKIVEVKDKCNLNGKQGVILKLIRGSSTYNTKEMSVFIEGVVNDAKTLGVETLSPKELKTMMDQYEGSIK